LNILSEFTKIIEIIPFFLYIKYSVNNICAAEKENADAELRRSSIF